MFDLQNDSPRETEAEHERYPVLRARLDTMDMCVRKLGGPSTSPHDPDEMLDRVRQLRRRLGGRGQPTSFRPDRVDGIAGCGERDDLLRDLESLETDLKGLQSPATSPRTGVVRTERSSSPPPLVPRTDSARATSPRSASSTTRVTRIQTSNANNDNPPRDQMTLLQRERRARLIATQAVRRLAERVLRWSANAGIAKIKRCQLAEVVVACARPCCAIADGSLSWFCDEVERDIRRLRSREWQMETDEYCPGEDLEVMRLKERVRQLEETNAVLVKDNTSLETENQALRDSCGSLVVHAAREATAIRVDIPNRGWISGTYEVVQGAFPNKHPLWKQSGGSMWLFSGKQDGHWCIGDVYEREIRFACDTGVVRSSFPHRGTLPFMMASGSWQFFTDMEWVDDPTISVALVADDDARSPAGVSNRSVQQLPVVPMAHDSRLQGPASDERRSHISNARQDDARHRQSGIAARGERGSTHVSMQDTPPRYSGMMEETLLPERTVRPNVPLRSSRLIRESLNEAPTLEFGAHAHVESTMNIGDHEVGDRTLDMQGDEGFTFDVIADEGDDPLGWIPAGLPPDRMAVKTVESGSWADRVGLQIGDELVMIEGLEVSALTGKQVRAEMRKRPLALAFARGPPASPPSPLLLQEAA
eukprot:TRINITY_DN72441_c0_g1_i1.p1 TRINITY_DN72441_c0_g1~~TRINITY_DN72441_c0_g1_i1.p1  ORF type:complete len:648 (-),score=57.93 TRINITY_DN72441_c0_g1_i1:222-2165(-)